MENVLGLAQVIQFMGLQNLPKVLTRSRAHLPQTLRVHLRGLPDSCSGPHHTYMPCILAEQLDIVERDAILRLADTFQQRLAMCLHCIDMGFSLSSVHSLDLQIEASSGSHVGNGALQWQGALPFSLLQPSNTLRFENALESSQVAEQRKIAHPATFLA
jgi:hypothetical protein